MSKAFDSWCSRFERSKEGKQALDTLEEVFPAATFASLRLQVLQACYCAAHFKPTNDPHKHARECQTRAARELGSQIAAVKRLRAFMHKYPDVTNGVLMHMGAELSRRGIVLAPKKGKEPLGELFDNVLAAYEQALKLPIPGSAPGLSKFAYGCLLFDKPLESGKHPETNTLLLFNLVFLFRKFSAGDSVYAYGEPMPKPKNGRPHYSLACTFIKATLDYDLDYKTAQRRLDDLLNDNPGIGLGAWPAPAFDDKNSF